jgi:hypothetical protein
MQSMIDPFRKFFHKTSASIKWPYKIGIDSYSSLWWQIAIAKIYTF